jgi:energy-coupling factor transporter ATP-binding protein EcfA2
MPSVTLPVREDRRLIQICVEQIRQAKTVRLSGPAGSGKSRLLRVVAKRLSETATVRYVPEVAAWTMRAGEVQDALRVAVRTEQDAKRLAWLVDLMGVGFLRDRPVRELSHGERQRVLLTAALAHEADGGSRGNRAVSVVLDEPNRHLDRQGRAALDEALRLYGEKAEAEASNRHTRRCKADKLLVCEVRKRVDGRVFAAEIETSATAKLGTSAAAGIESVNSTDKTFARKQNPAADPFSGFVDTLLLCRDEVLVLEDLRLVRPLDSVPLLAHLQPGEPWMVAGPMGCGKTTLLKTIAGMTPAAGGAVGWKAAVGNGAFSRAMRSSGAQGGGTRVRRLAVAELGFVGAEPALGLFGDTVGQEIRLGARTETAAQAGLAFLAHLLGQSAADLSRRRPWTLSRAAQVFTALVAVLVKQPAVVLLDEPAEGLDRPGLEVLARLLAQMGARVVVLVATHEPFLLERFSRRVTLPAQGGSVAPRGEGR